MEQKPSPTPLQELIEEIKADIYGCAVNLGESGLTEKERSHYNSAMIAAKNILRKASELLKKETAANQPKEGGKSAKQILMKRFPYAPSLDWYNPIVECMEEYKNQKQETTDPVSEDEVKAEAVRYIISNDYFTDGNKQAFIRGYKAALKTNN